jgi:hypothetical protein
VLGSIAAALLAAAIIAASAFAASLNWGAAFHADSGAGFTSVSCASGSLCVAVDTQGTAFYNTTPTAAGSDAWTGTAADSGVTLNAVSCPATNFCVAVGEQSGSGAIATTIDPASSGAWQPTPGSPYPLDDASCPSTTFCLAVDDHGGALHTSTPSATTAWTRETIDAGSSLTAVSCASTALCAAIDANGGVLISTNPTSTSWTRHTLDAAGTLTAIACTAGDVCLAVGTDADGAGNVWATNNPTAAHPTWSVTGIDPNATPESVSCTAQAFCSFGDTAGTLYSSDSPTAAPPTWSSATTTNLGPVSGVSCIDAGICAAVDSDGYAAFATLPAPAAGTDAATAVTQTTATLTGTVDPNDAPLTDCEFDYGTSTSYDMSAPCETPPAATAGSQAVTATVAGLAAGTTYHFQLVAASGAGSTQGGDLSLHTPNPVTPVPTINGTPAVGQTLSCAPNVAIPASSTVSYAWFNDTTQIAGATGPTYFVRATDSSDHLYCEITISGDGASKSADSGYVGIPADTLGTVVETSVGPATDIGDGVATRIVCSPQAQGHCTLTLQLTTAQGSRRNIGSARALLAPGAARTVTVKLNGAGRSLLARAGQLRATLTVSGTVVGAIGATLRHKTVTLRAGVHGARRAARGQPR